MIKFIGLFWKKSKISVHPIIHDPWNAIHDHSWIMISMPWSRHGEPRAMDESWTIIHGWSTWVRMLSSRNICSLNPTLWFCVVKRVSIDILLAEQYFNRIFTWTNLHWRKRFAKAFKTWLSNWNFSATLVEAINMRNSCWIEAFLRFSPSSKISFD